jgi:ATP-dependent Clp protease ATP-binding subunit ClpX
MTHAQGPQCGFCGETQTGSKRMLAGPTSFICEDCVARCAKILGKQDKAWLDRVVAETPDFDIEWLRRDHSDLTS